MNFLKAVASPVKGAISVRIEGGGTVVLPAQNLKLAGDQKVTLGIRPEHIVIVPKGKADTKATVRLAEYLGSESMFYLAMADGSDISVKADGLSKAQNGAEIALNLPPEACHLFNEKGETILNGTLGN
jgi:multiple sugar transport system ATP-binding protein